MTVPAVFEMNPNALFRLPQLASDNFVYVRTPKTNFAYLAAPTLTNGPFTPAEPPKEGGKVANVKARGRSVIRETRGTPVSPVQRVLASGSATYVEERILWEAQKTPPSAYCFPPALPQ